MKEKDKKIGITMPVNFRTNRFILKGTEIVVAGLAGPHNNFNMDVSDDEDYEPTASSENSDSSEESDDSSSIFSDKEKPDPSIVFKYLQSTHREVLINLHEEISFKEEAESYGLEYYHIPVEDYADSPISSEIFDRIYYLVTHSSLEGKEAAIHCGGGDGRTGTALASLKLREYLDWMYTRNSILFNHTLYTEKVFTTLDQIDEPCTVGVKLAIEAIRQDRAEDQMLNGSKSVETSNDVQTLLFYENHLRKNLYHSASLLYPVENFIKIETEDEMWIEEV